MNNTITIRCPDCLSYSVRYQVINNAYICSACEKHFKMKESYKEK